MTLAFRERMKKLRKAAFERQGELCHWCKRKMIWVTRENAAEHWNNPLRCTGDHVLWVSRGGETTEENIVAACLECNTKRHPPRKPRDKETCSDWAWLMELTDARVRSVGYGPW